MKMMMLTFVIVLLAAAVQATATVADSGCDMAGDWLIMHDNYLGNKFYPAVDLPNDKGAFNVTMDIRHGPGVVQGQVSNGFNVSIDFGDNKTDFGAFNSNCTLISWRSGFYGSQWCRAWLPGCTFVPPPYGKHVGFWGTFGDNMVLQQGPKQAAAVYGIVAGQGSQPPDVVVTVRNEADGSSYNVNADINTVMQPFGPGFEWPWDYQGPFVSWKALLHPSSGPGGNFTIFVECTNCVAIAPEFTRANISNVTFGDVWYCSGQSNMWLPVGHTFNRNLTLRNITEDGKYRNIRIMAGNSGSQEKGAFNPWMTAEQSAVTDDPPALFQFGATCWYFAQKLTDEMEAAGTVVPIGLADTAVGGQRIEEYMDNLTLTECSQRMGENIPQWDGVLFGKLVVPFVDMTVKGFLWYQGENNMAGVKGNVLANVGYGCEMANLVASWRKVWSKTPGTTDPNAPFGIVTLASSGSEGNPWMGAMRWAQTSNYGVLPNPAIPNSFMAQAYDLDDPWGPAEGPCFKEWACCGKKTNQTKCQEGTKGNVSMCNLACEMGENTVPVMGGIHPRDKKVLGDRLGLAAYRAVYGGKGATTGPTLAGCSVDQSAGTLTVTFNSSILEGDTVIIQPYNTTLNMSYLEVQTDPSIFCVEVQKVNSSCRSKCELTCPSWAGGSSVTNNSALELSPDQGWMNLNISLASDTEISADLSPLGGVAPTAVRYAWGTSECCDKSDPTLYVTHPCGPAACPIMGSSGFPANPFIAKIVDGKCQCIPPQQC